MAERKEIIRVLGFIQEYFDNYADEQETDKRKELFKDWSDTVLETIALLKAQEPVKPLKMEVDFVHKEPVVFSYECPVCMCGLQRHWVACPICGTGVRFE